MEKKNKELEENLTIEQIVIRNEMMLDTWEKYKNRWTMKQISKMWNCSLSYFYEIIRKEKVKRLEDKVERSKKLTN